MSSKEGEGPKEKSTGTFLVASRYGLATPPPPFVLRRGVIWQGIGTLLAGVFGTGIGFTASVENAGLLGLTRHGSRRAIQIAAAFMIGFSILGKFAAFVASLSLPIVGAVYCLLYPYVVSGGMSFIRFCNPNSYRVNFIIGFPVFLGVFVASYSHESLPISVVGSSWWSNTVQLICSSPALGAAAAIIMDIVVDKGDLAQFRESGRIWWAQFRDIEYDTTSFYSLPEKVQVFLNSFTAVLNSFTAMVRDLRLYLGL